MLLSYFFVSASGLADQDKAFNGQNGQNGEKDDGGEEVMNHLMSDIQSGFVQRRLPDGGFKQQYSPMVMRKFKKSLDNTGGGDPDHPDSSIGLNSPRLSRKNRGGSFSGPSLQDLNGEGGSLNSPSVNRRRRSRIPSEEDDQLINFLVTGKADDSSVKRNLSVGNLVAESQQNYGSLDRGLMRRSRGRRRPEMLNIDNDRDRSAPLVQTTKPEQPQKQEPPPVADKSGKFKNRIESWLKDAQDDADKAEQYLDKKREKKGEKSAVGQKKSLTNPDQVDVLSAMDAVEDASGKREAANPRKKTPPGSDDRKKLIRELGRKPSQEKVSLYVRKPSVTEQDKAGNKDGTTESAKKFIDSMTRRSMEVPADFLNTIEEERNKSPVEAKDKQTPGQQLAKKYPFNRTNTPNSLREHLKETLTKNLGGSANDIAETIEHFKNDEILDTFNIDSENIETPPAQRRGVRQRSLRPSPASMLSAEAGISEAGKDEDTMSVTSETSGKRRNKFRNVGGDGKPLGDREIMLKKQQQRSMEEAEAEAAKRELEDELGSGLFDRFSAARKTLTRGSVRKKREDGDGDTKSLNEVALNEQKKSSGDWRSRLASKFKKSSIDHYDLNVGGDNEEGTPSLNSYRKTSDEFNNVPPETPMTEPTRRRTLNPTTVSTARPSNAIDRRGDRARSVATEVNNKPIVHRRKTSYGGDYDSELVDGKYVTSVPIVDDKDDGNIRPVHRAPPRGLRDLKAAPSTSARDSLMERLSRSTSVSNDRRPASQSNNVFDRLTTSTSNGGSRSNLSGGGSNSNSPARRATMANGSTTSYSRPSRPTEAPPAEKRGTFTKIKDMTKNLRRSSREEEEGEDQNGDDYVAPRNSLTLFNDANRKPMTSLNKMDSPSRNSINSSTRSLHKDSPKTTRRSTTSTLGKQTRSCSSIASQSTQFYFRLFYGNGSFQALVSFPESFHYLFEVNVHVSGCMQVQKYNQNFVTLLCSHYINCFCKYRISAVVLSQGNEEKCR